MSVTSINRITPSRARNLATFGVPLAIIEALAEASGFGGWVILLHAST